MSTGQGRVHRRTAAGGSATGSSEPGLLPLTVRLIDDSDGILFVLDGGKALRTAVKAVFGDKALVQRCRLRKERNVAD